MLVAENLAVGYPGKTILENLTLSAQAGDRIALVGLNGTGKSTLMLSLSGLLPVLSGEVKLNGRTISGMSPTERATQLAIVTTDRFKTGNMTKKEVVAMGRYPYTGMFGRLKPEDEQAVSNAMTTCGLSSLRDQLFAQLSDGQKQRVMMARALAQETPVVLLDEPTSFLDVRGKAEVFKLLERLEDRLVIFSTHEIERALEVATRCWVIDIHGTLHDEQVDSGDLNISRHLGLES